MTFSEAWRLTCVLLGQTDSHVAAAVAGWSFPESREARILADLFDLNHRVAANGKKVATYPRGTDAKPERRGTASMSIDRMRKTLDRHRAESTNEPEGGEVRG